MESCMPKIYLGCINYLWKELKNITTKQWRRRGFIAASWKVIKVWCVLSLLHCTPLIACVISKFHYNSVKLGKLKICTSQAVCQTKTCYVIAYHSQIAVWIMYKFNLKLTGTMDCRRKCVIYLNTIWVKEYSDVHSKVYQTCYSELPCLVSLNRLLQLRSLQAFRLD